MALVNHRSSQPTEQSVYQTAFKKRDKQYYSQFKYSKVAQRSCNCSSPQSFFASSLPFLYINFLMIHWFLAHLVLVRSLMPVESRMCLGLFVRTLKSY